MFAIENCYRIIFEAMLEDSIFMCIAERIEEYTKAGVALRQGQGKFLPVPVCVKSCSLCLPGGGILLLRIIWLSVTERKWMAAVYASLLYMEGRWRLALSS